MEEAAIIFTIMKFKQDQKLTRKYFFEIKKAKYFGF